MLDLVLFMSVDMVDSHLSVDHYDIWYGILLHMGKQYSPRCDAAFSSGAILFDCIL